MSSSLLPKDLSMPGDPEGLTFTAAVNYSKDSEIVECLSHYFKKVVEDKPDDVVKYLLDILEGEGDSKWVKKEEVRQEGRRTEAKRALSAERNLSFHYHSFFNLTHQ